MNELYELKDRLCDELKEYGRKELSNGTLDTIDKLTHTIKNLDRIIEKHEEDDYSHRGGKMGRKYSERKHGMDRYSYHGDMISELYELMEEAPDESTKHDIKRLIQKMESNRG